GWLAIWLHRLGAKVRGYALDPCTHPNLFTLASVGDLVDNVRGDVRDYAKLEACVREFEPEIVFHMAAQPIVRRSYTDPVGTYSTNVMGTVHVLEVVRKTPSVRAVVCITTDKVYDNQEWVWPYRETDPLGGHDPYASSKACAEIVCAAYRGSFFSQEPSNQHYVALATARAGNVIGGGDWSEDRLIPDLVRGFCSGTSALIRRPSAIRPWQHVLEPLQGYLILADRLLEQGQPYASAYNFGPGDQNSWPVERIATKLMEMWGNGASWTRDANAGEYEAHSLRLDANKACTELGWKPRLNIETALQWTIDWFHAWNGRKKMAEFTAKQIADYETLCGC
ncbi:MAG TPA: CDP-glucose 4,6-dehydratase, partial [Candidatus Sulfotelmatobacter sp.]|nr:CDP-glucose 4,6-dehydratase [Candidatus Sulfotelmatobacter sp.]